MTIKQVAAVVAAVALASSGAVAKGPGGSGPRNGAQPSMHFKSHLLAQHHRKGRFGHDHRNNNGSGWPLYGYYAMPPYNGDTGESEVGAPAVVIVRDYQLPKLNCDKYRETIAVPSEQGGTRDVTITRC